MTKRFVVTATVLLMASIGLGAVCGAPEGDRVSPVVDVTPSMASPTPPVDGSAVATQSETLGTPVPISTFESSVASFDEFPVLWLGESFDSDGDGVGDMRLTDASFSVTAAGVDPQGRRQLAPETRAFYVAYGDCVPATGRESCHVPVTMAFYPPDSPLLPFAGAVRSGVKLQVRGVGAWFNGEVLWVETADFVVNISVFARTTPDRLAVATRIANQLYGANAKAAGITKDTNFRAKPPASSTPVSFPTDPPDLNTPTPSVFPISATETPVGTSTPDLPFTQISGSQQ